MQRDQESLYKYWSRFKRLLESCPYHGMNTHLLISYFTGGLCVEDRRLLTASSGGSLSKNKTEGEAWNLIKDVAEATQHTRDQKEFYSIQAIEALPPVAQLEGPPRIYGLYSSTTHYIDQCHQIQEEHALVVANVNYNNRPSYPSQGQNNYPHGSNQHQGWMDNAQGTNQNQKWNNSSSHHNNNQSSSQYHHNNTNYQANQNHSNQNKNNYTKYQEPHHRKQSNHTSPSPTNQVDELRAAMEKQDKSNKAEFDALGAQLAKLTNMFSKMVMLNQPPTSNNNTNQPSSSSNLPSQPQPNPKGGLNAITLRSGTTLEEIPPRVLEDIHEEEVVVEAPHEEGKVDKRHEEERVNLKEPKRKALVDELIPIPFPSMVKKAKKTLEFDLNMLQMFKKVEHYATFYLCAVELAPLKKSAARFALADKSVITVTGIAKDVLVAIKDLVFPVDFYILEMPPTENRSSSFVLLGRPFLKTSKFKLDAFTSTYSFEVGDKTIKFNLEEAMKHPPEEHFVL
ncbi:uncharacterized protein LOC107469969 [Arachis duranensis]|uniref:Uncharacterized protein LOC107469969 n=1 Tax=Arachis duranensis TaxID=130453 RepID=A0A6P4BMU1_ARADU|nr:uncharacterized protein LOC107469969 [Arachis duranensis]